MKSYYLNVVQDNLNTGSALLFRTTDKMEFYNYIKLITEKYKPFKNLFKVVEYGDIVVVSFCDNAKPFERWYMLQPTGKVDRVELVRLDNLIKFL